MSSTGHGKPCERAVGPGGAARRRRYPTGAASPFHGHRPTEFSGPADACPTPVRRPRRWRGTACRAVRHGRSGRRHGPHTCARPGTAAPGPHSHSSVSLRFLAPGRRPYAPGPRLDAHDRNPLRQPGRWASRPVSSADAPASPATGVAPHGRALAAQRLSHLCRFTRRPTGPAIRRTRPAPRGQAQGRKGAAAVDVHPTFVRTAPSAKSPHLPGPPANRPSHPARCPRADAPPHKHAPDQCHGTGDAPLHQGIRPPGAGAPVGLIAFRGRPGACARARNAPWPPHGQLRHRHAPSRPRISTQLTNHAHRPTSCPGTTADAPSQPRTRPRHRCPGPAGSPSVGQQPFREHPGARRRFGHGSLDGRDEHRRPADAEAGGRCRSARVPLRRRRPGWWPGRRSGLFPALHVAFPEHVDGLVGEHRRIEAVRDEARNGTRTDPGRPRRVLARCPASTPSTAGRSLSRRPHHPRRRGPGGRRGRTRRRRLRRHRTAPRRLTRALPRRGPSVPRSTRPLR